jgi:hypothetical protein
MTYRQQSKELNDPKTLSPALNNTEDFPSRRPAPALKASQVHLLPALRERLFAKALAVRNDIDQASSVAVKSNAHKRTACFLLLSRHRSLCPGISLKGYSIKISIRFLRV